MDLRQVLAHVATAVEDAAAAVGRGWTERGRARRELRGRPVLGPASAEGDHVLATGFVRILDESLVAPLTGRTCVAYRASAAVRAQAPRRAATQHLTPLPLRPRSLQIVPFLLESAAGDVVVDGEHAIFDLSPARRLDAERTQRFLVLHGFTSEYGAAASFREIVVEPGTRIAVVGVLLRDAALGTPAAPRAFREGPAPVARLTGSDDHPLVIGTAR